MTYIDNIVGTSLVNLSETMPNTAQYIIEHGCFISTLRTKEGKYWVVADFTTPMLYDELQFNQKTCDVYNEVTDDYAYYEL